MAKEGDFVFCDPPYDYDNQKGFNEYSSKGFSKQNQIDLVNELKQLNNKKIKWMLLIIIQNW